MFKISVKSTPTPDIYDVYVADIRVSKVMSYKTRERLEEEYQLPEVWKRYWLQNEELTDTDLEITSAIGHLIAGLSE